MNNKQRYDNLNERGKNYFTWLQKRNGTIITDYQKLNLEQLLDAVERWVKRADEEDAYLASRPIVKWEMIIKKKNLKVLQVKAMLRMIVPKYGKESKEVQELGEKFMAANPTEEEIDEVMEYFEKIEDKPKPRTSMDELREKQKRAKAELDSKRDKR